MAAPAPPSDPSPAMRSSTSQPSQPSQSCAARLKAFVVTPLLSAKDTPLEAHRKTIFGVTILVVTLIHATMIVQAMVRRRINKSDGMEPTDVRALPALTMLVVIVLTYALMLLTKRCTVWHLAGACAASTIFILATDLRGAAMAGIRGWPMFMVMVHVCLVFRAPDGMLCCVVGVILAYLVLTAIESGFRYGLYDLPILPDQEARRRAQDCAALPCRDDEWFDGACMRIAVVLFDFYMMRTFAWQVTRQAAALEDGITVARMLTGHLVAYDLEAASACLSSHEALLAPGMAGVYAELVENMQAYRRYLPDALFVGAVGGGGCGAAEDKSLDINAAAVPAPHARGEASLAAAVRDSPTGRGFIRRSAFAASPLERPVDRRVSLLLVHVHTESRLEDRAAAQALLSTPKRRSFFACYAATLEHMLAAVKGQRGSLDFFNGERMQASFNAFGTALNHCVNAMGVAASMARPHRVGAAVGDAGVGAFDVTSAVATGLARVGSLGSDTLRQPSVVGALPMYAGRLLQAACAVDEGVLCTGSTRREARFSYDLELLLHTFVLGPGAWGTGREVLYALRDRGAGGEAGQEWMYDIHDAEGSSGAIYSEAAYANLRNGLHAAREVLERRGADPDVVAKFAANVAAARMVDVRPRVALLSSLAEEEGAACVLAVDMS